jgi:hypothetical protein
VTDKRGNSAGDKAISYFYRAACYQLNWTQAFLLRRPRKVSRVAVAAIKIEYYAQITLPGRSNRDEYRIMCPRAHFYLISTIVYYF